MNYYCCTRYHTGVLFRRTTYVLEVYLTQSVDALKGGKRIWLEERDPLLILLGLRGDLEGWGRSRSDRHGYCSVACSIGRGGTPVGWWGILGVYDQHCREREGERKDCIVLLL